MKSFGPYLDVAIKAARAAGDLLRTDFQQPTGPRGQGDKAPVDTEAEQLIRGILLGGDGDFGFLGEETGAVPGAPSAPIWVVDPNDGTRDYVKGRRGSSVSIALVWEHRPVLGVVHPFGYPDGEGAMYAAVDGREGVWKNGAPVTVSLPARLSESDVVLVSGGAERAARANLECTRPARVISIPSIAHRLARVAAGEASAATSLYSPQSWDFAAGHCLIRAAGGALVDQHGDEPVYDGEGGGTAARLFAGSKAVALDLAARDWDLAFRSERETSMPIARLARGGAIADSGLLARAQGALLGHLVGSAFSGAALSHGLPAGQLGAAGEIAVANARSLLDFGSDDASLRSVYAAWTESSPWAPERAMEAAASGHALASDLSEVALARVTPLTLWGRAAAPSLLAAKVRADTALTHPSPLAGEAAAVLAIALQSLIQKGDPAAALEAAHAFARRSGYSRAVIDTVALTSVRVTRGPAPNVLTALHETLFHLGRGTSFPDALDSARARGLVADAGPALVGAFIGACFGRDAIPERLRNLVLSCRPMDGHARYPRPSTYWATDAMAMSEALLTAR